MSGLTNELHPMVVDALQRWGFHIAPQGTKMLPMDPRGTAWQCTDRDGRIIFLTERTDDDTLITMLAYAEKRYQDGKREAREEARDRFIEVVFGQ